MSRKKETEIFLPQHTLAVAKVITKPQFEWSKICAKCAAIVRTLHSHRSRAQNILTMDEVNAKHKFA